MDNRNVQSGNTGRACFAALSDGASFADRQLCMPAVECRMTKFRIGKRLENVNIENMKMHEVR